MGDITWVIPHPDILELDITLSPREQTNLTVRDGEFELVVQNFNAIDFETDFFADDFYAKLVSLIDSKIGSVSVAYKAGPTAKPTVMSESVGVVIAAQTNDELIIFRGPIAEHDSSIDLGLVFSSDAEPDFALGRI